MAPYRLLFCDDLKSERTAFKKKVASRYEGVLDVALVSSLGGLDAEIESGRATDIVVTDVNFESVGGSANEGKRIVERAKAAWPDVEVVIFTARPRDLSAEEVLELSDLGLKRDTWVNKMGDDPDEGWEHLAAVLEIVLKTVDERRRTREYRDLSVRDSIRLCAARGIRIAETDERFDGYTDLIGKSPRMRDLYRRIERVAPTPAPVLLLGETGAGKELASRAIHACSGRKGRFVDVNCSEFSKELLAAELFGHVRGAYTGADVDRDGLLVSADDGTFLLDEIGEMALENQAKLLRALETGEVRPVGSSVTRTIDVRIVAATNRDLHREVETGGFRRDLLSRIGAYPIVVPALRDRPEDIALTACHFLAVLRERYRRPLERIDEGALSRLVHRKWPGNVRELRNVVIRLLVNIDPEATVVTEADIPADVEASIAGASGDLGSDLAEPQGVDSIFSRILDGSLRLSLPNLAKTYGKPTAIEIVRRTMLHYDGLPKDEECDRLFDMTYRSWQHWAHYNGLTWRKVKASR